MRVLHLTRDLPPRSTGGISTAVASAHAALREAGVASIVISFDHWRRRERGETIAAADSGGAALRVRRGSPLDRLLAVGRDFRPSVVHLHHENLWPFAAALRDTLACPVAYSVHVLQTLAPDAATVSASDQAAALVGADLIVVPSRYARRAVAANAPAATPVHVVPNIVEANSEWRVRPEPIAVYAGRFDRAKGTDLLFVVMRDALSADTELRFEIAGGLPASPRRERRWQRHWQDATPPELLARARFHGWLDGDRLARMHGRARLQVVPSRCETFGLSAAEAMARGVPVVATRAGALPELVDDGETGLLAEPDDAAALAAHVLRLIADADHAAAMGKCAAVAVRRRFSRAAVLPSLLAAYGACAVSAA